MENMPLEMAHLITM